MSSLFERLSGQGNFIRSAWDRLSPYPGGKWLFSKILGQLAPYSGSIDPRVLELRAGHGKVQLRDRRPVRNHLRSVHAVALLNLAEMASGLALLYSLPPAMRGIIVGLSIEYEKKARGTLTAVAEFTPPTSDDIAQARDEVLQTTIRDAQGDVVARVQARWRIGPARKRAAT